MSNTAQKMVKARANLVMSSPFFGTLALRMKVEEDPSVKLCSTDGTSLRYNPAAVKDMPLSKVVGMLAHTVMHPAMLHHTRRGDRDIARWNKACDYTINNILHSSGFDLPEGKFINPAYDGMPAEHIYTLLPPDEDDQKGNGNAPGDDSGGAPPPNTGNDPGGDGGVEDSPNSVANGSSQSQQNHEEAEWKQTLAQATHAAKQAGRLPAGIERMMQELLQPVLPWKNILKRFMTEKCNDDFSWKRGNRRFVADDLYLPSRVSDDAMGTMVVAIDTSGSIGERELSEFGAEISDIHAEVKPRELIVIYCDAEVNHIDRFGPEDTLHFKLRGGGGTDFRPPFEWLTENQIVPRAFAYLTDGYGPFPETEPEFPNIWCINNRDVDPPYGEHIVLEV